MTRKTKKKGELMAADWDYAILTHDASENGGPGKYLDSIRQDAYDDGFERGSLLATAIVTGGVALYQIGKFAWEKISAYRERREEEKNRAEYDKVQLIRMLHKQERESDEKSEQGNEEVY